MKRAAIVFLLLLATLAHAAPRQVLVLRAEGTADAASRATIEGHVTRLAKNVDGKVDAGDITYSDAAAAAGCSPSDVTCKDEILMTFAVDELVATTVTSGSGGQLTVTVRRLTKGAAPRAAASTLPAGKITDSKLDADLGPLFGLTPVAKSEPPPPPVTAPPPVTTATPPAQTEPVAPTPAPTSEPAMFTAQPALQTDAPPSRKWPKIGMGVGAGLVALSFVMWAQAAGKQDDIDSAPTNTRADFDRLEDLEREADDLAGGGNLFFIAGLVVGGVSGYYYWKRGPSRTQSARITPTIMPGGAGVVLTFGGSP